MGQSGFVVTLHETVDVDEQSKKLKVNSLGQISGSGGALQPSFVPQLNK
jgi:hypothetical protein